MKVHWTLIVFTNRPDMVMDVQVVDNLPLYTDHDTVNVAISPQSHCKLQCDCGEIATLKGHYVAISYNMGKRDLPDIYT